MMIVVEVQRAMLCTLQNKREGRRRGRRGEREEEVEEKGKT